MKTEKKLRIIGFTNFVHLNKSKRDLNKRLFFTSKYNDSWFTIMLIEKDSIWEVEKITGDKDFLSFFDNSCNNVNDIILFFKEKFYFGSEISTYL
jgi:hypothetical protein